MYHSTLYNLRNVAKQRTEAYALAKQTLEGISNAWRLISNILPRTDLKATNIASICRGVLCVSDAASLSLFRSNLKREQKELRIFFRCRFRGGNIIFQAEYHYRFGINNLITLPFITFYIIKKTCNVTYTVRASDSVVELEEF
jgi:hypothetical protein